MSLSRGVLAGVATYVFVALLLVSGVSPPLVSAVLAAPYALLVPVGLGLLLCFGWRGSIPAGIGRVQTLLLAWFVGTFVIVYTYVMGERYGLTEDIADILLPVICGLSAIGILRMRREISPNAGDLDVLRLVLLVGTSLTLFRYLAGIFVYSDFPVMDLFQRVHFHIGALEFAKHNVVNPFVANSYIPYQQLLLGLMARGAHVDPLMAEWVLPVALAPLQVSALFVVVERLTHSRWQLGLALGFGLALQGLSNPTNGDIAELAALLLLSLLVSGGWMGDSRLESVRKLAVVVASIGIGLVVLRAPIQIVGLVIAGLIMIGSAPHVGAAGAHATLISLAVLTTLAFHRGAVLFIALVLGLYAFFAANAWLGKKRHLPRVTAWLSVGLLILVIGMVVRILLLHGSLPRDEFGLWSLFDYVLRPMIGKSMTDVLVDYDLAQGAGGRIALFEVGRRLSPLGVLIGGVFLLRTVWKAEVCRNNLVGDMADNAPGVALILACLLLLAMILTGFPFVHRAAFMIVVLFAIALARFMFPIGGSGWVQSSGRVVTAGLMVYMAGLLAAFVLGLGAPASPYFVRVYPLLLALLALGGVLAAWPSRGLLASRVGVGFLIAVLLEATALRTYFKPYTFANQTPPKTGAFSHYGHLELAMADQLASVLKGNAILVSDPKTMALVGARSGNPPLISFSNLNTMPDDKRRKLGDLLRTVVYGGADDGICWNAVRMVDADASGQVNYILARQILNLRKGRDLLAALNYDQALIPRSLVPESESISATTAVSGTVPRIEDIISFTVVISPDTLDWINHPFNPSYFPAQGNMTERTNLQVRFGDRGRLVGNAFVLSLECK